MIHAGQSSSLTPAASPPHRRGKHKIFIGMAPGVGKTYRMLEEGQQLKQEGFDVVIGLLETHGREETAQKAIGLEQVPLRTMIWQGRSLLEMDTGAILARSPQLALVDELAHTNIPGAEREKRYQDVELILAAGIDVYSTINIQHLESLNDLVYKISGVVVRERVPDRLLDEADEVVVVDVTPETLQERLQEGKIYAQDKINQALQNFFKRQNLVALRELALREVANNIEENSRHDQQTNHCAVHERILVCISTYPNSIQLLRRGGRIASQMNGRLFVLFVAPTNQFLSKVEALHVETCQHLTQEFEGEFIRQESDNVVGAIAQVATTYRITQIVLGESRRSRWHLLIKGSIIQRLMRCLPTVDLHIIANG
ncbi:potassium-transporting ATPase D chain [Synechocystis sp. PCC 6803]|uniref:Putative sensor protein KdpD n=1 Tax=Synechocystis sp. (strain ATCC 27184 / PCC 6803 / Kazusa) TaxID=1111708 RepID=KDPD_SYNY3|nr:MULTISPECIES: sensor histidine kinase KdpD [unclassified Synechocystis]P73870.1 RecName: Full=Putative sensor protein KdpD [Synechocystis sp. PCC 6803 substr. Kazusa]AGF51620.1 potassium-transporting ATPase D chain [Synechocystis sp. PCC 6803]ALJ67612.1 histidine kinase [Synechocystis sp. PCC 6803]AVP89454.1 histidine kinase [Synechocystis sp. IPPAS B-1465]MBD2619541.1 sensor histidine kinase KdpD [Synechocystis sp. FACHB-898]MBD2639066.1 sensor histidine kinase KdpD [Synechocystis sp. FAC